MKKCPICKVAVVLAGIGALNWLLISLFNFNVVETIFGSMPMAAKVVYILVGLSGLLLLVSLFKKCPGCKE